MHIAVLAMVKELGQFCLMTLTVLVPSHHYFRADILVSGLTTVITVKTLAFNVETLEVRMKDNKLFQKKAIAQVQALTSGN